MFYLWRHRFVDNTANFASAFIVEAASATVRRSNFIGNAAAAGSGSIIRLTGSVATLEMEESVVTNSSGAGVVVYVDPSVDPFAVTMDTVSFKANAPPALYSESAVLVMNCYGLEPNDVVSAIVGTCANTEEFCMAEARRRRLILGAPH